MQIVEQTKRRSGWQVSRTAKGCPGRAARTPVSEFHADGSKKPGHSSTCIACKTVKSEAARDKAKPERRRYRKRKKGRRNAEGWLVDNLGIMLPPELQRR